jgi:hypothetical protein
MLPVPVLGLLVSSIAHLVINDGSFHQVTDENKKEEDWGLIMEVCDRVGATTTGPKVTKFILMQGPVNLFRKLLMPDRNIRF